MRKRYALFATLAAAALLVSSAPAAAATPSGEEVIGQAASGTLRVNVTDSTGAPMRAEVMVLPADTASERDARVPDYGTSDTFTGLSGEYIIRVMPLDRPYGHYSYSPHADYAPGAVTAAGTLTREVTDTKVFTVNAGTTTYVNVQPVRATTFISGTVTYSGVKSGSVSLNFMDQGGFGHLSHSLRGAGDRFRRPVQPGSVFRIHVSGGNVTGSLVYECTIVHRPADVGQDWHDANPGREFRVGDTSLGGVDINLSPGGCWSAPGAATFSDVPLDGDFFREVEWLASSGITTGWDMGTHQEFRPTDSIERQAMAAFLYRGLYFPLFPVDQPVPTFSDKSIDGDFFQEIEWLSRSGISTGWDLGTHREFRPGTNIERQAMAAFLYRASGSPPFTPPATATFQDVPVGAAFFREIEWLASTGITTGWDMGTHREFRPAANVERQAMAAFLYRAFAGGHL